jgi:hypothetical protein
MMTRGNYLPNLANYAYKYLTGSRSMSETGLKPRKERDFRIRKSERTRRTQSPKNKAKIMKGGVLTSTAPKPISWTNPQAIASLFVRNVFNYASTELGIEGGVMSQFS